MVRPVIQMKAMVTKQSNILSKFRESKNLRNDYFIVAFQ
jgi:hypothetical protein